jgi:DNA-binding transcriptional LysR family regulator
MRQLSDGRLVRLMKGLEQPPLPVNLLFRANRQGSPNVRAFIDAARQYFARRDID